ncbi:MAG: hypothetical protein HDR05_05685 [Lachnospiraceae bacterium]|nr:hypothetical protein [Lachnospiraceae bacterium]
MGADMDERQRKATEWLDKLGRYASEKKFPMRIMDEMEECRKLALSGEAEWAAVSRSVEELLESIEGKITPTVMQERAENEVSAEDIKAQLEKMARRCHAENTVSADGMGERKNTVIKKMYAQIFEISHTKAHLEELKNEDLYLQFFSQSGTTYERDVIEMIRELLQSISNNYANMLNHMKSMFQSIGGYRKGIGNEKFYMEYEARRLGIDQRVLEETQTADVGGNDITSFGQKTKEAIKGMVRKLERKRKLLSWMPVIVLLCLLMAGAVVKQSQSRQETERIEETTDNAVMKDIAQEFGEKVIKEASPGIVKSVVSFIRTLLVSLGAFLGLVLLVIVLLYIAYLKILKQWCNHQICKRCGEYLKTELSRFEQENGLSLKLDTVMLNAVDEYERQYMEVLNQLFTGTDYERQNQQRNEMAEWNALREQWNTLKYR